MKFSEMAARLDALEAIAWDWIGGGPATIFDAIKVAEAEVIQAMPSASDIAWIRARLARAVENDWCSEAMRPLLACLERAERL